VRCGVTDEDGSMQYSSKKPAASLIRPTPPTQRLIFPFAARSPQQQKATRRVPEHL